MFLNHFAGPVEISANIQNVTFKSVDYVDTLNNVVSNLSPQKIILHQDNCRVHFSKQCQEFYAANDIELMKHPAYSPDLAPCDFWLFKEVKKNFKGKEFDNENDLAAAVYEFLGSISPDQYAKCFKIWFERMKTCIKEEGRYFEIKRRALKDKNT